MEDIEGYLKKYQKIVDYNNDNLEELRVLAKHTVKSQHLIIEKLQQENKQLNYFLKEEKEISSREHKAFQRYFDKCEQQKELLDKIYQYCEEGITEYIDNRNCHGEIENCVFGGCSDGMGCIDYEKFYDLTLKILNLYPKE